MSSLLPKRISELGSVDSDIDTPDKFQENMFIKNEAAKLPRRIADLDIQEYDSDDDRNDKFNCAILNDSFVLSPSKDLPCTPASKEVGRDDENDKNFTNLNQKTASDDSGFISRIKTLEKSPDAKEIVSTTNFHNEKLSYRPLKSRTQLFQTPMANMKSVVEPAAAVAAEKTRDSQNLVPSVFQNKQLPQKREEPNRITIPCPRVPLSTKKEAEQQPSETPFKKSDQQLFVTPSARPFPATQYHSTTASTCDRDVNKKPKILFTTPSTGRPLPGLSLQTPVEMRSSSIVQRKLSPIKEPSAEKEKQDENILAVNSVEYIIDKKIGSGGSSSVYLARIKKTGKECAIKLVDLDGEPQVIEGYLNETKLLAKLQGNINVVALYDYCHIPEKNILYMVMEKGESDLHKILQTYMTDIPLYTLMNYWYQMLQAVNYIHQNGVIHSDLKPANFLMIQGRLKLIDFGIASNIAIDSTSIIKFSQAGTFNYISPEALIDTSTGDSPSTHHQPRIRLSTKSDVWSLGSILYLLLYKKTPFSHIKVLHHKISALTNPKTVIEYPEIPNFYPPVLIEMLKKCLVYNPKERSSVADLLKYPFDKIIPI